MKWKTSVDESKGVFHVAVDAGYPVEALFLAACVADDFATRQWLAPYPLHEVQTAVTLTEYKLADERRPNELPMHNPLADARQSARIWLECTTSPTTVHINKLTAAFKKVAVRGDAIAADAATIATTFKTQVGVDPLVATDSET